MKEQILSHLSPSYPWREHFHYFPELDSTNTRLKAMAKEGAPHGTVLIAGYQTGGHGRMGRSFHSPGGMGVYLSILLRPNCPPSQLMHLTCAAAVSMCDAVENATGLRPGIKWTNDLVHGKRKLGGILTELGLSPKGMVDWAIIGIGINCRQRESDFAPDIRTIAASLSMVCEKDVDPSRVAAAMMDSLSATAAQLLPAKDTLLSRYRTDCITLNKDIVLVRGDTVRHGTALDIDDEGALIVRYEDGTLEAVNSGEVSVRGMYGYL